MQCFRSFHTAERTLGGVEATHVMRKGQAKRFDGKDAAGQAKFTPTLLFGKPVRVSGTITYNFNIDF